MCWESRTVSITIEEHLPCREIPAHRGAEQKARLKAVVAIQHSMLVIIWNMIHNGVVYREIGPDYYARFNPGNIKNTALRQLRALGYNVELTPAIAAWPPHFPRTPRGRLETR